MKYARNQRGNSLVMALVILVMITLLAITNFRISDGSISVTGNLQHQEAVLNAADSVIQEAISTVNVVQSPGSMLKAPCNGIPNTRCLDINADGSADVTVQLTPAPVCVQAKIIPVNELDIVNFPDLDRPCLLGVQQNFGIELAPSSDSLCANTLFEVTAVATDALTSANVTVAEGVAVRTTSDDVETTCI